MDTSNESYGESQFTRGLTEVEGAMPADSLYQNFENLSMAASTDSHLLPQSELVEEYPFSSSISSNRTALSEDYLRNSHSSSDQELSLAGFPQPQNFSCTLNEVTSEYPQHQSLSSDQFSLQSDSPFSPPESSLMNAQIPKELETPSLCPSSDDSLTSIEADGARELSTQRAMEERAARLRARGVTIQTPRGPILFIPSENHTENSYIPSGSDPSLLRLLEERDRLLQDKEFPQKLKLFQRLLEQKRKADSSKKKPSNSNTLEN